MNYTALYSTVGELDQVRAGTINNYFDFHSYSCFHTKLEDCLLLKNNSID